ncbi:MAG: PASTA domain-containing protein [Ruminiclostridium sp.]|nr:PASTA domain-containing protein [Ruminiclostridium sp.]
MKKALAVFAALLMVFCTAGCDSGNKPAQTEAVTTTADPDSVEVPDFSGLTRIQIEMKYPKLNIVFDEKYDDTAEEDEVISQSPSPGTKIKKSDEIMVEISLGGKLVEVDDYTGRSYEDAKTLIEKQGLVCDMVYDDSETVARNCIISTLPSARTMVEKGSTVICYVSLGSANQEIHMPDFTGMTIEDATKVATDNNIMFSITYDDTSEREPGTVIKQGIEPDTVIEPNTRVEITIAGENASASKTSNITVTMNNNIEGEFELKYYIDGTLQPEKTEIKELSLTRKIEWEVSGTDIHTYSVVVTSLTTGKSDKLYVMEVDFNQNPPTREQIMFNGNVFKELLK